MNRKQFGVESNLIYRQPRVLVYLVSHFIRFHSRFSLNQLNKQDKPNELYKRERPDEPDRPDRQDRQGIVDGDYRAGACMERRSHSATPESPI